MDQELYERAGVWFEAHREELVQDIVRLVRIPSVSDPDSGKPPFGAACREVMDEMLQIGREHGFVTENYDYRVGSIGTGEKNWENMIGFWNHLDVVPAGNFWEYEPFEPVMREHFLIGRGAQDNKGPAVGMLYVMQCLRELGVPLKHELCLFVGCDEERGMEDLAWYRANHPCPAMSMIADSGFPVCYGEKGIMEGQLAATGEWSDAVISCQGGSAGNMIPDLALAVLKRDEAIWQELQARTAGQGAESRNIFLEQTEEGIRVTARGTAKHSAFPEGSRNAIYELASFLAVLDGLEEGDRELFRSIAFLSEKYDGTNLEISYEDAVSGRTTCAATVLTMEKRRPVLNLNIRYAITDDPGRLQEGIRKAAGAKGYQWRLERDSAPNYFPKEHPAVSLLTGLYQEVTGERTESFVMGGGTYARKLPNAFAYGIGGMRESEQDVQAKKRLFKPGHGGAHEPDEGLNVRQLLEALRIYVVGIAALNDCPLQMEKGSHT